MEYGGSAGIATRMRANFPKRITWLLVDDIKTNTNPTNHPKQLTPQTTFHY
jgi:hypothetical protein